jgi:copper chaperone CopZ
LERSLIIFEKISQSMKKVFLLMFLAIGLVVQTNAQVKKKKAIETVTIQTPNAQCEQCKNRIELFMAREEGVTKTVVDYKKKVTKVSFWNDRTNIENVKTALANGGYDADDVTAEPDAYKRLPKSCKKPEDGGHPKKQ